jgi:hypothetical protein
LSTHQHHPHTVITPSMPVCLSIPLSQECDSTLQPQAVLPRRRIGRSSPAIWVWYALHQTRRHDTSILAMNHVRLPTSQLPESRSHTNVGQETPLSRFLGFVHRRQRTAGSRPETSGQKSFVKTGHAARLANTCCRCDGDVIRCQCKQTISEPLPRTMSSRICVEAAWLDHAAW